MRRLALLLAALGCGAVYLATEGYLLSGNLGFPLDDAWIHLQFARSLAGGQGLAYNPGVLVAGSTAPLWTAVLSLLFALPGSVVVWTKLLGLALAAAGVLLTDALARELGLPRGLAALAALLVALTDNLVWSSLSGMEIPLYVVLTLSGLLLLARERREPPEGGARPPLALPVLALAVLTRPEGLVLLVLATVEQAIARERRADGSLALRLRVDRRLLAGLGLAALVIVPVSIFFVAIGGSPLPTTFGAKAMSTLRPLPSARYLLTVTSILLHPQPVMFLLAAAGMLIVLARLGGPRDAGFALALWPLAQALAYSFLEPAGRHLLVGNFGRYYFPFFPVVVLLGSLALAAGLASAPRALALGGRRVAIFPLVALLVAAPTFVIYLKGAARFAQSVANVEDSDVRVARWVAANLPADALLAVQDIGAIKYFAPNRVLDLCGIVSPEIRPVIKAAMTPLDPVGEAGANRILEERRPDYLVAFPSWFPRITADRARFQPLVRVRVPDNITMAGDEILVYATPWVRTLPRRPAP